MAEPVGREEYLRWRADPVSKWAVQSLFNKREMLKEGIAEGNHENENLRLIDIGRCQGLKDVIDYIVSDFDYLERNIEDNVETDSL